MTLVSIILKPIIIKLIMLITMETQFMVFKPVFDRLTVEKI